MNAVLKRGISLIALIAVVITMSFSGATADAVYAEEGTETAVSVYMSDDLTTPVKSFSMDELKQIAKNEGDKIYNYSGYNTFPTFKTSIDAQGPTVLGIINTSGIKLDSDTLVRITDRSGYSVTMTGDELNEDRYYFPNGKTGTENGGAATEAAYKDSVKVPAIIDISSEGLKDNGVLRFGQVSPNEQNFPGFVKYVGKGGKIIIGGKAVKCKAVQSITDGNGKLLINNANIVKGTQLQINSPENGVKIYYSLDGSEPTDGSKIYNYSEKVQIKYPSLDTVGKVTLKVMAVDYGKYDSDITTFVYNVVPAAPKSFKVARAGYDSIRLTWSTVEDAEGYIIQQYDPKTKKYNTIKTINDSTTVSKTITGLKTGTEYKFVIKSYCNASGEEPYYSPATPEAKATPSLSRSSITKLSTGSKKVTVKWTKVSGAKGYKLYRATSKSGKYKLIKTTGSNYYTNKSLQKGKKYYYKVKAYRVVDGKNVYSSDSAVKYIKAK